MPLNPHHLAYLRLARLRGVGPVLVKRLLEAFGSAEAVLAAHPGTLAAVEGIGTIKANGIVGSVAGTLADATEELHRIHEAGVTLLTLDDDRYPPGLKTVPDPPLVLYVRGELQPQDAVAIGMVGARECTLYGREQATRLGAQLAEAGLTVVSGGARGIDTCAHLGALRVKGRTVVVQGCGLNHTYPPENVDLYQRIVKDGAGAIVSELPLEAPPAKENFPPRNRIIAGMSLGIVVVEANLRSGSLITARLAAADYGREVFALPGRVDSAASAGTHHLLKMAQAHLVETAEDILGHLGDVGRVLQKGMDGKAMKEKGGEERETLFSGARAEATSPPPPAAARELTTVQRALVEAMPAEGKGISIDELVEGTNLAPQVVMAELTHLQLKGVVARMPANRFVRRQT